MWNSSAGQLLTLNEQKNNWKKSDFAWKKVSQRVSRMYGGLSILKHIATEARIAKEKADREREIAEAKNQEAIETLIKNVSSFL